MVLATSSHPRAGGDKGLLRVTSSPCDHNSLTGSGLPLTNSPCTWWNRSISWSTSSTADIRRDHLRLRQILLSLDALRVSYAIHPSAWNGDSAKFAYTEFSEVQGSSCLASHTIG